MVELANTIWADGPSSAPQEPQKAEIRAWGTWVEGIITAFTSNGGLIYDTFASYAWLYIGSWAVGLGAFLIALTFRPFPKVEPGPVAAPA